MGEGPVCSSKLVPSKVARFTKVKMFVTAISNASHPPLNSLFLLLIIKIFNLYRGTGLHLVYLCG